jgi:hypothetical protein
MSSRFALAEILARRAEETANAENLPIPVLTPVRRTSAAEAAAEVDDAFRAGASVMIDRLRYAQAVFQQFEGKRDFYKVLGYKKVIEFEDYVSQYERGDIAARIIDIPAEETWSAFPNILDADGAKGEFAKQWAILSRKLNLPEAFTRLDRAAGIGHYGVAVVGFRDGGALNTELRENSVEGVEDVLYVQVFAEGSAKFDTPVEDPKDPRYGKPLFYRIDFNTGFGGTSASAKQGQGDVHASRVIHLAEGRLESDLFGIPRLKTVYNRLFDLAKVIGASGETFWLAANKGLHANIDPKVVRAIKQTDLDKLATDMEAYRDQLTRMIRTTGIDIKDLGSDVINPRGVFAVIAAVISGSSKIPYRMLFQGERGAATSTFDRVAFREEVILPRQTRVAEPQVIRPFVELCIFSGALPHPKNEEFNVVWPDPVSRSRSDQAAIAKTRAEAAYFLARAMAAAPDLLSERQRLAILGIDFDEEGEAEDSDVVKSDDVDESEDGDKTKAAPPDDDDASDLDDDDDEDEAA